MAKTNITDILSKIMDEKIPFVLAASDTETGEEYYKAFGPASTRRGLSTMLLELVQCETDIAGLWTESESGDDT